MAVFPSQTLQPDGKITETPRSSDVHLIRALALEPEVNLSFLHLSWIRLIMCWWKKSCTSWYGKCSLFARFYTLQVVPDFFHQQYVDLTCPDCVFATLRSVFQLFEAKKHEIGDVFGKGPTRSTCSRHQCEIVLAFRRLFVLVVNVFHRCFTKFHQGRMICWARSLSGPGRIHMPRSKHNWVQKKRPKIGNWHWSGGFFLAWIGTIQRSYPLTWKYTDPSEVKWTPTGWNRVGVGAFVIFVYNSALICLGLLLFLAPCEATGFWSVQLSCSYEDLLGKCIDFTWCLYICLPLFTQLLCCLCCLPFGFGPDVTAKTEMSRTTMSFSPFAGCANNHESSGDM